jgi:lysylphosphatidylglycerol synthetase-like protein (DUF2156 family)
MALPSHALLAGVTSLVVLILSLVMGYLAYKSYRRTANAQLLFVGAAFGVFAVKAIFVAVNVTSHAVPHDAIEFVSALFDLVIVGLLFIPFFTSPG